MHLAPSNGTEGVPFRLMPMRRVSQQVAGENSRALVMPKDGVMVTTPIRAVIDDEPDRGCDVEVLIGISDDEPYRLVVDELIIRRRPGGPPLTTTTARASCKIPQLLDDAIAGVGVPVRPVGPGDAEGTTRWSSEGIPDDAHDGSVPPKATRSRRRHGGPVRLVDDADVLAIVRRALAAGRADYRKAVVDELRVGKSTAARAIDRLKTNGQLTELESETP